LRRMLVSTVTGPAGDANGAAEASPVDLLGHQDHVPRALFLLLRVGREILLLDEMALHTLAPESGLPRLHRCHEAVAAHRSEQLHVLEDGPRGSFSRLPPIKAHGRF